MSEAKEKDNYIRALLVGPNGSGKTILAASFPGPTLIVDVDKRNKPIRDWYEYRLADYDVLNINPYNLFTEWQPALNKMLKDGSKYNTVILDGLTSMSNLLVVIQMMNKGLFTDWSEVDEKKAREEAGKITKGGIAVPSWDEFNGEVMLFSSMLECLKALKCNFFLTAHPLKRVSIKSGDKTERYESLVTFGPKLESMVPGYFDEVWYISAESDYSDKKFFTRRLCYTRPSPEFPLAKTAIRKLPPVIDFTNNGAHEGMNFYDKVKEYI